MRYDAKKHYYLPMKTSFYLRNGAYPTASNTVIGLHFYCSIEAERKYAKQVCSLQPNVHLIPVISCGCCARSYSSVLPWSPQAPQKMTLPN